MFAEDYDSDDDAVGEPKHEHQPAEPMHQNVSLDTSCNMYYKCHSLTFLNFLIDYNTIRFSLIVERKLSGTSGCFCRFYEL